MTKKQMIEYIGNNYDWIESMQQPLGHHSWWYTNRRPEACIDVKIHSWVDMDKIAAKLSDRQQVIDTLHIDLEELCNDYVWSDYGLVAQAREDLLYELKKKYNVIDLEYGGKSGGWLAVVYRWDGIYSDFEDSVYNYSEVREIYTVVKKAIAEHEQVTALVLERKRELEQSIEDPENYIEQIEEYIDNRLEVKADEAKKILALV